MSLPTDEQDRWHRLLGSAIHKPVRQDVPAWPGVVLAVVVGVFIWLASYQGPR